MKWQFPWTAAAAAMDLPTEGEALPAATTCPLCHESGLRVYEDLLGAWCHCRSCRFSGPIAELAAKAWRVEIPEALTRLAAAGAAPEWSAEEWEEARSAGAAGKRQSLARFWRKVQGVVPVHGPRRLLECLRWLSEDQERWQRTIGRYVGAATLDKLSKAFGVRESSWQGRVFGSRGRPQVLVVPYYDAPERFSGAALVGDSLRTAHFIGSEAGLAFLDAAALPDTVFGGYVFAVNDPWLALRVHIRHLNDSARMLPLVAWHQDEQARTTSAWRAIEGRLPIFWAWRLDGSTLAQAIQTNGAISLTGPDTLDRKAINHWIRLRPPRDLLRHVLREALPWSHALSAWLKTADDAAVNQLMNGLAKQPIDHFDVGTHLPRALRERWQKHSEPRLGQRTIRMDRFTILECDTGWYSINGSDVYRISEGVLRLDRVLFKDGVPHYQGRILYRGQTFRFEQPVERLEKLTAAWLTRFLLSQGQPRPYASATWSKHLLAIAAKFQEPLVVADGCPAFESGGSGAGSETFTALDAV